MMDSLSLNPRIQGGSGKPPISSGQEFNLDNTASAKKVVLNTTNADEKSLDNFSRADYKSTTSAFNSLLLDKHL